MDGRPAAEQTLLYSGATYVPLRAAAEILGKQVTWDEAAGVAAILSADGQNTVNPTEYFTPPQDNNADNLLTPVEKEGAAAAANPKEDSQVTIVSDTFVSRDSDEGSRIYYTYKFSNDDDSIILFPPYYNSPYYNSSFYKKLESTIEYGDGVKLHLRLYNRRFNDTNTGYVSIKLAYPNGKLMNAMIKETDIEVYNNKKEIKFVENKYDNYEVEFEPKEDEMFTELAANRPIFDGSMTDYSKYQVISKEYSSVLSAYEAEMSQYKLIYEQKQALLSSIRQSYSYPVFFMKSYSDNRYKNQVDYQLNILGDYTKIIFTDGLHSYTFTFDFEGDDKGYAATDK